MAEATTSSGVRRETRRLRRVSGLIGQGEEDFVEGWAAHTDVLDGQACFLDEAGGSQKGRHPISRRQGDALPREVDHWSPGAESVQQIGE
jgi:hypothetical protein